MSIETFSHLDFCLQDFWFCIFLLLPRRRGWRKIRPCQFCTLIDIVTDTTLVSFRALPVGFPLPTISKNSLSTLFCPLILDHGACFKISVSGLKKSSLANSARYFFVPLFSICDNQVQLSSDESPYCIIPVRS